MNIYSLFQDSEINRRITKFNRKYRLNHITLDGTTYSGSIAITNGTPDDNLIFLLCSKLNGNLVTSMFKPMEGTRYASLSGLYDLIGPNIETILIVIDQEDESTEDVFGGIEKQLRNYGYRHERETDGKIAVYACEKGGKQFKLIVVLNGVDEVDTVMHCIEDHLVVFFGLESDGSSKDAWNGLGDAGKEEVLQKLTRMSIRQLKEYFPNQIKALELFLQEIQN